MITLVEGHDDWPVPYHRYRIEDDRGWCEFSIWNNGRFLGSYGGSTWPFSWPDIFEYVNPKTYFAGYVLRHRAVLPSSVSVGG